MGSAKTVWDLAPPPMAPTELAERQARPNTLAPNRPDWKAVQSPAFQRTVSARMPELG